MEYPHRTCFSHWDILCLTDQAETAGMTAISAGLKRWEEEEEWSRFSGSNGFQKRLKEIPIGIYLAILMEK